MRWLVAAALVAMMAMSGARAPEARAGGGDPAARLEALGMALNAGDVDAAVAMFAEDGVVRPVTQGGQPFVGREAIRRWAGILVSERFHVEFDARPAVDGRRVLWQSRLWLDQYRDLGVAPATVVVEVEVEDDKIKTFSSTVAPGTRAQLDEAAAARDVVLRFFAALNAGDPEAIVMVLADDVQIVSESVEEARGIAGARRYFELVSLVSVDARPIHGPYVVGDRVSVLFQLSLANLEGQDIGRAEVFAMFYVRDGAIRAMITSLTPGAIGRPTP